MSHRILFIYRGYGKNFRNSVIDTQRLSLIKSNIDIDVFIIKRGGLSGYISAVKELFIYLKIKNIDIVHAHYGYSGILAGIVIRKPIICSLMGSDLLQSRKLIKLIIKIFVKYVWKVTIVKSLEMQKKCLSSILIPNGVDFSNFRPIEKKKAALKVGFNLKEKNIIFVAEDINSAVKNLSLATYSISLLKNTKVKLHLISGKTFTELPYFYNAADVLLLTSLSEGSSNVIKEAMACNCPIVATDVGDIRHVISSTKGCYITDFNPENVATKLRMALAFNKKTNGRKNIQYFNDRLITIKILGLYNNLINYRSYS
jgi:glycosyltransferase involved in cell wall biosynthesis